MKHEEHQVEQIKCGCQHADDEDCEKRFRLFVAEGDERGEAEGEKVGERADA